MGIIGPNLSAKEVRDSAVKTMKGEGLKAALPGVAADAHSMDKDAYQTNRELAKRIQQLLAEMKPSDKGVPRFVLGFRMYPNSESPYWKRAAAEHICGCGCGCWNGGKGNAPARKSSAKKRSAPRRRK
jgi:hypothetical protein